MKKNATNLPIREDAKTAYTNRWLTGADVKSILQISESTLGRRRKNREIPYTKIGKEYYYPSVFFDRILLQRVLSSFRELFEADTP